MRVQASIPSMFFHENFKLCSSVFNTNDTVMGKFLFREVWR